MALLGAGAVCIWNDITDEGRAEFYDWHLNEHMPERAAVPGFLRSRRFIATNEATRPEFFTLYETRDPGVLTSEAYLARLNAPTPWTKTATQAFRNTSRALTSVKASLGPGAGGALATLRFDIAADRRDEAIARIAGALLPEIARRAQIAAAHLCVTDQSASAARTAESRERSDIQAAPNWIILIEACGKDAARTAAGAAVERLAAEGLTSEAIAGVYRLEFQC